MKEVEQIPKGEISVKPSISTPEPGLDATFDKVYKYGSSLIHVGKLNLSCPAMR
jgi:hypothetical protein